MIERLLSFIQNSKSVFHTSEELGAYLEKNKFQKIDLLQEFKIKKGGKYFITKNGATIAFKVDGIEDFKIVVSHTDSPTIKIKSNPDIKSNGYNLLNVEVYGGPILNTWFDKPLSIAGIVHYLKNGKVNQKIVDFKRPVCTIPNLAIHMNREINQGVAIDKQKDLKPVISVNNEPIENKKFLGILADEIGINKEDILSYELNLYNTQAPVKFGLNEDFIQSPRLDNLSMAFASVEGLLKSKKGRGISLVACLDNEEIGSETFTGGSSDFLPNILERISLAFGKSREEFLIMLEKSFVISADLAHSVHPNYAEKSDLTNKPIINGGFVIKNSSNKRYATDSETQAHIMNIAKKNNISYQLFFNNSNVVGGSSLGPIISARLGVKTIDIGNPIFAMHSERETGGVHDYIGIVKLFEKFFGDKNE